MNRIIFTLCFVSLLTGSSRGEPPYDPDYRQESEKGQLNASSASGQVADSSTLFEIGATWVGTPQWMGGIDNGYEAFGGSLSKGEEFFGSSLQAVDYVPVEIRLDSDTANWSLIHVFRRDNLFGPAGVGTFPGSAWDISDPANPRRLNVLIAEYDDHSGPLPPPNFTWDPDSSAKGKYEYVFVMNSDYDGTGMTYAANNVLLDELDNLYAWWPKLIAGRSFFETSTAELQIKTFIGLHPVPLETEVELSWVNPGPDPAKFKIFWAQNPSPDSFLIELPGSARTYTHFGLTVEQEYYYQIKSYDILDNELSSSRVERARTRLISLNVSLFGKWHQRGNYGDIWGYTDSVSGKEYALICARSQGLSIIDIDDTPFVEVGFVPGGSDTKDVKTYGHFAVIFSEGAATQIADISDVSNPIVISTIPGGRHNGLVDGHYVYLVGGPPPGGLVIYSILDPSNPTYVSEYQPYYYHDIAIRNDTLVAAAIYGQGVDILDVSNKDTVVFLNNFNYPGSGSHNAAITEDGKYVIIGDEIGSAGHYNRVFDISDLNNINKVADIIVDLNGTTHNSFVKGEHLYIAHYAEGLRVWNISDPVEPYEVAFYDTHPEPIFGLAGAWGVYPFFESGKIVLSDMQLGLFVFNSSIPGSSCCVGNRGDINGDGEPAPDVFDMSYLISVIFRGGPPSPCELESDLDADGIPATVIDLVVLIDNLFRGGPAPAACP